MVSSGNSRQAAFLSALRSVAVNSLALDAAACPAVIARPPLGVVQGHPVGRRQSKPSTTSSLRSGRYASGMAFGDAAYRVGSEKQLAHLDNDGRMRAPARSGSMTPFTFASSMPPLEDEERARPFSKTA